MLRPKARLQHLNRWEGGEEGEGDGQGEEGEGSRWSPLLRKALRGGMREIWESPGELCIFSYICISCHIQKNPIDHHCDHDVNRDHDRNHAKHPIRMATDVCNDATLVRVHQPSLSANSWRPMIAGGRTSLNLIILAQPGCQ